MIKWLFLRLKLRIFQSHGWTFLWSITGAFWPCWGLLIFVGLLFSWWLFLYFVTLFKIMIFLGLFKIVGHFWLSRLVVLFEDHNLIFYFSPSSFLSFSPALLWSRRYFLKITAHFSISWLHFLRLRLGRFLLSAEPSYISKSRKN